MSAKLNLTAGQIPRSVIGPIAATAFPEAYGDRGYEGIGQQIEQQTTRENVERVILVLRTLTAPQLKELGLQVL